MISEIAINYGESTTVDFIVPRPWHTLELEAVAPSIRVSAIHISRVKSFLVLKFQSLLRSLPSVGSSNEVNEVLKQDLLNFVGIVHHVDGDAVFARLFDFSSLSVLIDECALCAGITVDCRSDHSWVTPEISIYIRLRNDFPVLVLSSGCDNHCEHRIFIDIRIAVVELEHVVSPP